MPCRSTSALAVQQTMLHLIPTREQWRGWSLPSKLTCIGAYLAALGILVALLVAAAFYVWPPLPGEGLAPTDFQVRLLVSAHASALEPQYAPPKRILVYSNVGPVTLKSELELQPEVAREYPSIKTPVRSWNYVDRAPFVDGLNRIATVDELIGQTLSAHVPTRAFKFKSGAVTYQLHIHIRGREIVAKPDQDGRVEVRLTKKILRGG